MPATSARAAALCLILAGCQPPDPGPTARPPRETGETEDTGETGEPGPDTGGADTEELPGWEGDPVDPADWLFGLEQVHGVDLQLSEAAEASLRRSPYDWVEASITVDDLSLNPVGLRLKGKVGSFRDLDSKAGFKVDFNRFDPELELAGLERLNLDNMVQDPSCNRDRLAYRIFEAVGIAVPRVGYAQVTVNGELFGLYALIESYDDVFLDRAYPDPSGNLYDGDYTLFEDGSYVLADFQPAWHDNFQLDEGQDVDREDIHRVTEALRESCDTEAFEDSVGAVVDLEQFAMFWAGEIWVGQWDGYAFNNNNIRVYFDPDDEGRAHLHPWDLDNAFSSGDWILSTSGELAQCCRRDEVCHARFHDSLEQIGQASGTLGLLGELDDALELIEPSLREDPRLEFDVDDVEDAHSELLFWLQVRENVLGNYPSL